MRRYGFASVFRVYISASPIINILEYKIVRILVRLSSELLYLNYSLVVPKFGKCVNEIRWSNHHVVSSVSDGVVLVSVTAVVFHRRLFSLRCKSIDFCMTRESFDNIINVLRLKTKLIRSNAVKSVILCVR